MGIHDREYYRESTRDAWSDWFSQRATVWLVAITCGVYVFQLMTRPAFNPLVPLAADPLTQWGAFDTRAIWQGQVWRLFTPMFLHSTMSPFHLVFNMVALYWFGNEIERVYGSREYVAFYLTAGVLGSLVEFAVRTAGVLPDHVTSIGASGAVSAVMVLFACHFPHRQLRFYFLIPVPAWLFVVCLLVIGAVGTFGFVRDGVNHAAHLLGAAFGAAYFVAQPRISPVFDPVLNLFGRRPAPARRKLVPESVTPVRPAVAEVLPPPREAVNEQFEAQLDRVLEKVNRTGRQSLSAEEQNILNRASELYKRRRSKEGA